ncbi:MAG TPA: hypothetical protein VFP21_01110 [Solirubrobacterales bacterium]|nr:hypothetical protein [Solirubrobacterales bacterium]
MPTRGFPRFLLITLGALVLFGGVFPAGAVPIFSRKYQTSCQTCHAIFPKLNPFGQAFRLNGYRMPAEAEDEDVVKEKPVSLGADAYKRIWPDAVYPGTIPGHVPIAVNMKFADVYGSSHDDTGHTIVHNDFQFPQEVNLFTAGTLGDIFSYFGELTYAERPDGGSDVEIEHAQFHVNSPFGPPHLINFKLGKFSPDLADGFQEMWIMTDNGIDALFAFDPIGQNGGTGFADPANGVALPAGVKGIEMYGVANHRLFYTLGVVNGISPGVTTGKDARAGKDFYARVDYKFGGLGLDGDPAGAVIPPENWRETSLRLGLLGYRGDGSKAPFEITDADGNPLQIEDRTFTRAGVFASLYCRDLNVFGVYVRGTDKLRLLDDTTLATLGDFSRDYSSWFVEADYVIKPPFQVSLRYESLRPGDPQAQTQQFVNANFSYLVRANVKTMLEYRRDVHDSLNYALAAVLRVAF